MRLLSCMMSLVTLWFFLCRAWGLLVSLARVHGEKTLVEVNRQTIRIRAMVFGIAIGASCFLWFSGASAVMKLSVKS